MPTRPALRVLPTADVPGAAASFIADALRGAAEARGIAHWATTGGSSAPAIYRALIAPPLAGTVPWERVHTWWGDDRFVPYDHELSNVRAFDAVLGGSLEAGEGAVPPVAPVANRHPWPIPEAIAASLGPDWVAARYAEELERQLPAAADGSPVLDLLILGVGPDGHILSVFPGSVAFDSPAPALAIPAPTHIEPHVERVTLNPRLVAAARQVLVTTTGAAKAANLARAWGGADPREIPVAAALLSSATWLLDEAAAAELAKG
jgi:6-phosphogluconolactonase